MSRHTVYARRVSRIGVQTLWRQGRRWFVSIENRTYQSRVELTASQAMWWALCLREGR